ncbi:MAG: electron transfer flavoprotein subunit alpha/FixB family protein, partial [Maribacter sp.]|nr:electron transfer flavoprotein subunit alpha/FixB family protein [Maribacter sp.]
MKSIFVYCEVENQKVADISQELLSTGKKLAVKLGCQLEAMVFGSQLDKIENQVSPFGVDKIYIADNKSLEPYRTLPHASLATHLLKKEDPQIVLFGATSVGRDLAPRIASALNCGLTADTTILDIGNHFVKKEKKEYQNLLYAIRPAFGGSIMANIINWDQHPQMATVREGVMKKEVFDKNYKSEIVEVDVNSIVDEKDFAVKIIERHIEESDVNLKEAPIIVAGGYGVGSKENFELLEELAELLGGEVGGSRAAVDAGFIDHDRQIGQTGTTVRP